MSQDDIVAEGVEVRESGQGKFQMEVRAAGATFLVDEPVEAGGQGSGPTPYDLLAAALGACTAMTIRLYAERKAWPLASVIVRVLHHRDGLQSKDRFAREVVLEGALTPDQRQRLLEIANRCPVHQTLERGSDVITVLTAQPLAGELDPEPTEHMAAMVEACRD